MLVTPDYNPTVAFAGQLVRMMTAEDADETVSTVICPSPSIKNHTFFIRTSDGVTGAIQLESAPEPNYAGVWNPIGGGGPIDLATIAGGTEAGVLEQPFSGVTFKAVRARTTTVVAGGDVTVDYLGQK